MPDATFRIKGVSQTDARLAVRAGKHELFIDKPESMGGSDMGPTPLHYTLAALAGCLHAIGRTIAKEMKIELRSFEVTVTGSLNPDKLQGKQTDDRAGFKKIEAAIKVESDADAETLAKWLEAIETRCPVSENLTNPTDVKISFGAA